RPPTHRRCLVQLRDVLHAAGRRDLHEATLQLLGWAHLRRQEVEAYLADCAMAFDRAVAVTRTPVPFQFKLQAHVPPYIIRRAHICQTAGGEWPPRATTDNRCSGPGAC